MSTQSTAPPSLDSRIKPTSTTLPSPATDGRINDFLIKIDNYRWLLFSALILLYLTGYTTNWLPGPDSSQHLIYADHLYNNIPHPYSNEIFSPLSPGLAFLINLNKLLFQSSFIATSLFSMLLVAFATLYVSYHFFKIIANRNVAVLLTLMLGCCETFYRYTFQLLPDLPFFFGLITTLYAFECIRIHNRPLPYNLSLLILGLAAMALFKSIAIVVIVALCLSFVFSAIKSKHYRQLFIFIAISFIAFMSLRFIIGGPTTLHTLHIDERIMLDRLTILLPQTLYNALTNNLPRLLTESLTEAVFALDFGTLISPLFSIPILIYLIFLTRIRVFWGILTALFITQWLAVIVADRYILTIIPLIIIAWYLAPIWYEKHVSRKLGTITFTFAIFIFFTPNIVFDIRQIIQNHTTNTIQDYKDGKYTNEYHLSNWLTANTPENAIIIAPYHTFLLIGYLSNRSTYFSLNNLPQTTQPIYFIGSPTEQMLDTLQNQQASLSQSQVFPNSLHNSNLYLVIREPNRQ
ncbi:hypothetical protein KS4_22470 [Poriferisphaera corsica]|uniref:Glycosyltransferase RgtA/B/C/D-like domain-containing protein n=1 Tax=Poriferisphaera corsica TaxID=2528020 RepID=A0A517YVC9_9BACT|nr:hypothetical protein KS4_22470 [Poriferisphaera corsica]